MNTSLDDIDRQLLSLLQTNAREGTALLARKLGVRVLSGLHGNVSIPKHGTGLSVGWVAENSAVSDSSMSPDSVTLSPKHCGGVTELSRQLIMQGSPDVEQLVRDASGKVLAPGGSQPFNGRAYTVFREKPAQKRQEFTFRHGVLNGDMMGWDVNGEQVEKASYKEGQQVKYDDFTGGKAAALKSQGGETLFTVIYPPSPPSWRQGHWLGTNSQGGDILAVLYGGWQQALIASALFLTFVFAAGVTIGGVLGYFGGLVDLLGQRFIEIWSVLPFLFVVMIVSSLVEPTMVILVGIIGVFGWMETATYLRTATYREKERDYVSAARLLGAGPLRVMFKHILPNTIAILVTLAPFKVAGIITALASLDFLGFGLPPAEPSWGRLLHEGTENFNYPWIVSGAFAAMVVVLVLVTFVGEAVREAFDPKKFTTYK